MGFGCVCIHESIVLLPINLCLGLSPLAWSSCLLCGFLFHLSARPLSSGLYGYDVTRDIPSTLTV